MTEKLDIPALADAIDPRINPMICGDTATRDSVQHVRDLIAAADALRSLTTALEIGRAMGRQEAAKNLPVVMQEEWSDFCSDAEAHPNDIVHRSRKLFYEPAQWTESIQRRIRSTPSAVDLEGLTETVVLALAESHVEPRPNNSTKVSDWLTASDLRRAARAVLSSLGLHAREN